MRPLEFYERKNNLFGSMPYLSKAAGPPPVVSKVPKP